MLHSSTRDLILQLLAPRALPELLDVLGLCQLLLEHLHYYLYFIAEDVKMYCFQEFEIC